MIKKEERKCRRSIKPSTLAVAGRYILTPDIFPILEKTPRGKGNEIQLTDALRILLKHHGIMAQIIEGRRHDLGDKLDFLKTTIEFALKRDEFAKPLREFLKQIIMEK
jgi:UTP--glucose-1-phosphate uridylyltransferase